ncbi:MAG: hypothetical protein BWY94_02075 [Actinobacteria bacterium ADurb.BinA094]|nr:MAG: hypothetical protein BWY94_02075 [Actinobacteria bacterium ADurb.BinA094]
MSLGWNPATTPPTPWSAARKAKHSEPVITLTCPGRRNPRMGVSPSSSSALSASGMVLWRARIEKLRTPRCRASTTAAAVVGAVVSKPMPTKTTSRVGSAAASSTASSGE